MSLYAELVRRHVFRVGLAYLAAAWLIVQVAETLLPVFGAPAEWVRIVVILLAVGFPVAIVLAWTFQFTPAGLRVDAGTASIPAAVSTRGLDRTIIVLLVLAVGYFAIDKFVLDPARDSALVEEATEAGRVAALTRSYGKRSIIVLPFVNLSADAEQEYFADGLTEELLNVLSQVEGLRVISRTTAFTFKGQSVSATEVSERLDVAHVLEGSVRRAGDRLRVTVQLIDGRADTHLWSQNYDRDIGDIFEIQDDISRQVLLAIEPRLGAQAVASARTDPRAYDLYLRAHHLLNQVDFRMADQAIALLERALAIDPDYVPALSELARACYQKSLEGIDAAHWTRRRDALVRRLVELDPDGSRANGWLGFIAMREERNPAAAARYIERALAADPTGATTLRIAMEIMRHQHREQEAIEIGKYLVERDPACGVCIDSLARVYRESGRHLEAARTLEEILEWRPADVTALWSLGVAWLVAGNPANALAAFEKDASHQTAIGSAMALHDLGLDAEFEEAMRRLQDETDASLEGIARIYAWTGDNDLAFEWIEKALAEEPGVVDVIDTDLYEKIKTDPRWAKIRQRYGARDSDDSTWADVSFNPTLPVELRARIDAALASSSR